MNVVLDPGHGGRDDLGKSSASGVRGPSGTLEKDVTLRLARLVSRHLGGDAALTRSGDHNLTLAARAACAKDQDARVFVSLHANGGAAGSRGAETWVHDRSRPDSRALAASVQRSLATLGGPDRGVRRGELAVLTPERLGGRTAACLVEVDFLSDPEAERRFGSPDALDRIAAAIARGVRGYLQTSAAPRRDPSVHHELYGRPLVTRALAAPRVPARVKAVWAQRARREHHNIWHYVRTTWPRLTAADQTRFTNDGWAPPRLAIPGQVPDTGAGIDFLAMHREMVAHTNAMLALAGDRSYPRVAGWNPIPFTEAVPPASTASAWAKTPAMTATYQNLVSTRYENDTWYQGKTLDDVGAELESGIHNWMHMHWTDVGPGSTDVSVANDYLGSPFSSAVNDVFWMLHGWIDDRIAQWERVNAQSASLSSAWMGRMPPRPTTLSRAAMSSMAPASPDMIEPMPAEEELDPVTHALWLDYQEDLLAWTFPELTEEELYAIFPDAPYVGDPGEPVVPPDMAIA